MLYIWPLFAFFSAPLLVPSVLSALTRPIQYLRSLFSLTSRRTALVSIPYTLLTIFLSLAVVKYNTTVHPFTLADNRHYMFYIFRYTILRSPAIRLSLVAAYTICRWAVWDQLAGISHNNPPTPAPAPQGTTAPNQRTKPTAKNKRKPKKHDDPLPLLTNPASAQASSTPPRTSTALLWLLTTALSLITAPLVEPRYFILPWVFYRLLVPAWTAPLPDPSSTSGSAPVSGGGGGAGAWVWKVVTLGGRIDPRLVLETAWFVVVNGGTMYMFLCKGFYWRGEDGELLDGGRVQRFMW
jgi:alpha-1,2-glucosyltransferase